jgi:hypothetical protein
VGFYAFTIVLIFSIVCGLFVSLWNWNRLKYVSRLSLDTPPLNVDNHDLSGDSPVPTPPYIRQRTTVDAPNSLRSSAAGASDINIARSSDSCLQLSGRPENKPYSHKNGLTAKGLNGWLVT